MKGKYKEYSVRLLEWWVLSVQKRALPVVVTALLVSVLVLFYSVKNFRVNVDISGMISENLPFRKLEKDFARAFPNLNDTIVLVIDADDAGLAMAARDRLAERLSREGRLFRSIYVPGGGNFFEKNGLLYMNGDQLEDFADTMAGAQPLLALFSRDLSLSGLFSVLDKVQEQASEGEFKDERIDSMYAEMGRAFDRAAERKPYHLSWQKIMLGEKGMEGQRRQFIILQPSATSEGLSAGEEQIGALHAMVRELGLYNTPGVKVRMTGDVALSYENMKAVSESIGLATLASLLLVSLVIYLGLGRSGRLILAALLTLIMGFIWTTGFAIAFIGSLNMISITFAVLYIGLGIDYSIQFCLRYRELIESDAEPGESIVKTASGVGRGLFLSCITTAVGFYSFIPTAYAGVAELGLISGTGMFISFFANLTILPALLTLLPLKQAKGGGKVSGNILLNAPYRYSRTICIGALILGLAAAVLLPGIYFDYNPLNLYNKESESVVAVKELFKDAEAPPWTISVLTGDEKEATNVAERLRRLREVKMVVTLFDFVPEGQKEKLGILSDVSLFMPPDMDRAVIKHSDYVDDLKALNAFAEGLRKSLASEKDERSAIRGLYGSIERFKKGLNGPAEEKRSFDSLEAALLSDLPDLFGRLSNSLKAAPFGLSDLPRDLVSQYVSVDGRYRVQVFPSENITDNKALARFVNAVRTVAPDATDAPVTIYESGRAVISSFEQAAAYALIAITIILLIESRSIIVTSFILIPLLLAMLLAAAASVLLGIPLNFANVIVVPLLLGIGVHSGIIFVLRYRTEPPPDGNMLRTSTARAILFSSLTTMISTGSLSFSSHRGISSIGMLLTICFAFLIVSTLVLLPAILDLSKRRSLS